MCRTMEHDQVAPSWVKAQAGSEFLVRRYGVRQLLIVAPRIN